MYFTGIFHALVLFNGIKHLEYTSHAWLFFFFKTWKTIRSSTRRTIHLKDDGISDSQEIMSPQSTDEMLQNSTSDDMWTVVLEILWSFRLHLWWRKILCDCLHGLLDSMPCIRTNELDVLRVRGTSMFQVLVSAEFRVQPHRGRTRTSSHRKLLQISTLPCPDWAAQLMLKT